MPERNVLYEIVFNAVCLYTYYNLEFTTLWTTPEIHCFALVFLLRTHDAPDQVGIELQSRPSASSLGAGQPPGVRVVPTDSEQNQI